MGTHEFDVAIVGGGLAGSTLARQLRLRDPELRIGVFERRPDGGYKVGESTVEIAAHYLARRLQLNGYMFENHLLKHGLRYFYDTEAKDADLWAMSEIGTDGYPYFPSFQLDRARFDGDLRVMNEEAGIDVRTGVTVRNIQVDTDGGSHRFELETETGSTPARTRWLVDASGRARVLGRRLGHQRLDVGHPLRAVWGRFRNIRDIDQMGDDAFRRRVRYTARQLSTLHFCYPGYWIWVIPLRQGVFSVGVVGEAHAVPEGLRGADAFRTFLDSHRGLAQLLEGSEAIDTMGYDQVSYGAEQFFSPHRFGFTGESAAFADPFYSPGSDFIATENDLLTDLILRDRRGMSDEDRATRTDLYDRFMKYRFDSTMPIYRDLYSTLGCFELMKVKYTFDVSTYYNIWVDAYMRDMHLDADWITEQLRAREPTLVALENVADMFRQVEARLRGRGAYHAGNVGGFLVGQAPIPFDREVGLARKRKTTLRQLQSSFNEARRGALALVGDPRAQEYEPQALYSFMVERSLLADSDLPGAAP